MLVKMWVIGKIGKILTNVFPEGMHFLSKSDNNIRVKVDDHIIKRHKDNAASVSLIVSELQEESFDPILFFKPQGNKSPYI